MQRVSSGGRRKHADRYRELRAGLAVLAIAALVAWGLLVASTAEAASPGLPRFEDRPCWKTLDGDLAAAGARCGVLVVPERRAPPAGPELRLAVAVLPALAAEPEPDPILHLHGGPGAFSLNTAERWIDHPLRRDRALILLDQRGAGLSEPRPCPELSIADFRIAGADYRPGEEIAARKAAALACRDHLLDQGWDLGAWSSRSSAEDVEDLRRALGFERWNLLAVSYGTRLALEVMAGAGAEHLRSVVLDSAYPPGVRAWETRTPDFARALEELFAACAQQAACASRFPTLRSDYATLLAELWQRPARTSVPGSRLLPDETFVLNPQDLAFATHQLLYDVRQHPVLPLLLEQAIARNAEAGAMLLGMMSGYATFFSRATNLLVECNERAPFQDVQRESKAGEVWPLLHRSHTWFRADFEICEAWSPATGQGREPLALPLAAAVPTLVLGGRYDPVTPPAWGRALAEALPDAHFVELPVGHAAAGSDDCPRDLVVAFLADPTHRPATDCVAGMAPPRFVTDAVVHTGVLRLLVRVRNDPNSRLAATGLGALLAVGLLTGPLSSALGRRLGRPLVRRGWARRLAVASGLLAAGYWAILGFAIQRTIDELPLLLVIGLPAWTAPLPGLAVASLAVGVVGLVALIGERTAPRSRRLLDALLIAAAGLASLAALSWG